MVVLWAADLRTSYESPHLLIWLYFVFSVLVSVFIVNLIGRSFLATGAPGLLMLGCGVIFWGASGFVGATAGHLSHSGSDFANITMTIYSTGVLLSAACHLTGVVLSLRHRQSARPVGLWLATTYAAALLVVGWVTISTIAERLPAFFVQSQGGTLLHQLVLGSAITMFAVTATMLASANRRSNSAFAFWYGLALALIAVGLFGVMMEPSLGSALSWAGRAAQFLGGAYMLVAAVASVRESHAWEIPLEEALHRQPAFVSEVLKTVQALVVVLDRRGRIVSFNRACEEASGYSLAEAKGKCVWDLLLGAEEVEPAQAVFAQLRAGQFPSVHEDYWVAKDGARRLIYWNDSCLTDSSGAVEYVVGTGIEVTDRRQAEEALQESESRFQHLFEEDLTGDFLCTREGRILLCNAAFADIFGYSSADDAAGRSMLELYIDPGERDSILATLRAQGKLAYYETWRKRRDGTLIHIVENLVGHLNDQGELYEIQGYVFEDTERKRAEEAMRESEEKFRLLAETSPAVIIIYQDGKYVYVNPATESITGYTRAELLAQAPGDIVQTDYREQVKQMISRREQGKGPPLHYELKILTKDGQRRWMDCGTVSIRYRNKPAGLVVAFDITERKRAEEELRESERRWHDLSEALPQLVWTCNSDGRCDFLSQQWITYTGRSEAEQLDYGWLDQVHPEDRDRLTTAWDEAVASVTLFDIEFRIRRADGVYRWFKTRAVPVRNADGQVAKWFGSNTDIEDLKSTTEALRQSEEKHRTIVETAMEAIAIVDAKARIIFVNERWLEMFGYNPEEAVHMTHFDLVFPEDMAAMKQRWEFRKRGRKESYELRLRRKDGSPVWVLAGVAPNFGPEGEFIGTLTMLADVTERKRAEEALKKSHEELETRVRKRTSELTRVNKELQEEIARREKVEQQLLQAQKLESIGTLAGGIAHDINNILGPIVLNSEMALLDLPKGSAIRNNLEVIYQSGLRGKDLTRQMLLFGRKSENKQELLTLSHLVKETFRLLRSSIPTTVQMKFYLKTKSDPVYADASQLQQVIMNLCTNAAYAMRGTKGSIEISLQGAAFDQTDLLEADMQPGEYLVLSIKDTGPGMSEEVKKRIFEPFFTTKPVGEGTGLGLSVAYGIVKSHGGNITVDSKPGKGSIFKVYLPMAGVHVSEKAEPAKPIPKGKERVLFVDDEEMIVQSMRNMLERLGYKVTTATDSENALRLFSAKPSEFDLVITDQTMPRMSGEDLGKKLMRIRPDIPVILCTGYSDLVSSEKATSIGFRGFLMKPFSLRESAELVRRVLDQSRSE